jgi:hypothetical protein
MRLGEAKQLQWIEFDPKRRTHNPKSTKKNNQARKFLFSETKLARA